jgi:2,5-diamino-6-(ribosylamino)-4(3H)-pyrimidinone 5'-phosphate reductase
MTNERPPPPRPALQFPSPLRAHLVPYLPSSPSTLAAKATPFLTLTFATSLDSSLSLSPGTQTFLSGPETKAMTHYLRSQHDAILVGAGTAVADNPALNCRLEGMELARQPRPIVIDPRGRYEIVNRKTGALSECVRLALEGVGKGPLMLTSNLDQIDGSWKEVLETCGGRYIQLPLSVDDHFSWTDVLALLSREGIKSLMVEGGGNVINTLLQEKYLHLIDSVIVTIAPVWLGQGGVVVSPPRSTGKSWNLEAAARLKEVKWQQYGEDVVMCGRMN